MKKSKSLGVTVISCSTADQLLEAISPRSKYWGGVGEPYRMLFRGHADERYTLVPTAYRGEWSNGGQPYTATNHDQVYYELELIQSFYMLADRCGLALPEDSQVIRRDIFSPDVNHYYRDDKGNIIWPPREIWSLLGLAQHHGLATRLLDWSLDARTAAYFAASGAARWIAQPDTAPTGVKNLAIWALSLIDLKVDALLSDVIASLPEFEEKRVPFYDRISIITAPSYGNKNLHAQKGVFTLYHPPTMKPNEPVDKRPLNEVISEEKINVELTKFTLPVKHTPRLLRLLACEGVSGAELFPGYDGIIKGLAEKKLWAPEE